MPREIGLQQSHESGTYTFREKVKGQGVTENIILMYISIYKQSTKWEALNLTGRAS